MDVLICDVKNGLPISHTFTRFPEVFPSWHVQMLIVGEKTGTLPNSLLYLADLLTQRAELRRSITNSLAYPALIFCGTIAISGFLVLYAFPKIIPIFRGLHVQLPPTTRFLMQLVHVFQAYGLYIAVGITLTVTAIILICRTQRVRLHTDRLIISAPFIGRCVQNYCLATVFRTMHVLLKSGVRLDGALILMSKSVRNTVYKRSLQEMERVVLSGSKCTTHMREYTSLYPLVSVQLLTAGERTGSMTESARMAGELAEEALKQELRVLTAIIEPALMVLMGLVVGFVAIAIISPMYALTQGLSTQ